MKRKKAKGGAAATAVAEFEDKNPCAMCGGLGVVDAEHCPVCGGTGEEAQEWDEACKRAGVPGGVSCHGEKKNCGGLQGDMCLNAKHGVPGLRWNSPDGPPLKSKPCLDDISARVMELRAKAGGNGNGHHAEAEAAAVQDATVDYPIVHVSAARLATDGDIIKSYSADMIVKGKIRGTFEHDGGDWVCVGYSRAAADACRLVPLGQYEGAAVAYEDADISQHHYEGVKVKRGKREYVLTDPRTFAVPTADEAEAGEQPPAGSNLATEELTLDLVVAAKPEELLLLGKQLADQEVEKGRIETRKALSAAKFNSEIKEIETRVGELAEMVANGGAKQPVKCVISFDFTARVKTCRRNDTGGVVWEQKFSDEDLKRFGLLTGVNVDGRPAHELMAEAVANTPYERACRELKIPGGTGCKGADGFCGDYSYEALRDGVALRECKRHGAEAGGWTQLEANDSGAPLKCAACVRAIEELAAKLKEEGEPVAEGPEEVDP